MISLFVLLADFGLDVVPHVFGLRSQVSSCVLGTRSVIGGPLRRFGFGEFEGGLRPAMDVGEMRPQEMTGGNAISKLPSDGGKSNASGGG